MDRGGRGDPGIDPSRRSAEARLEPISNAERLIGLLRQRLLDRTRRGASAAPSSASTSQRSTVQSASEIAGLDDRGLRRKLIQNILADQFAPELVNDAKFQRVIDQVTETLNADPGTDRLLARLVSEIRAVAR